MNAPLARLKACSPQARDERRREDRHITCHEATLESLRGGCMGVQLADVSAHGCSVRGEATWLRQGAFVSIRLGTSAKLDAIVRWVRGDAAGMEFLHPVPADRFDWHDLMDFGFEA
ncbi:MULTISPECIES: PilZ domain-containing protein [Novosphingobium]|uniref:PilZ domain-containing protein n=1 Tax=unclassified Novosphingobium TaxID=2644732 RepID=UPI000A4F6A74|nr:MULTISPECIES: PilZ domain-containing protein [unclassified Novosphingobium]TCM40027.1 PilZ domain-containing protein [Novosphingobium sp. ST904]